MGRAPQRRDSVVFPEALTAGTLGGHSLARSQALETSMSLSVQMRL